jgi:drug/metabolite transporter (DMT)-like permease
MPGIVLFWIVYSVISAVLGAVGYVLARRLLKIRSYNARYLTGAIVSFAVGAWLAHPFELQTMVALLLTSIVAGGIGAYLWHEITHQKRYH